MDDNSVLFFSTEILSWKTSQIVSNISDIKDPFDYKYLNFISKYFYENKLLTKYSEWQCHNYSWNFSFSPNGDYLVILKSNNIELRCNINDYQKVLFNLQIKKDLNPNWCKLTWSNHGNYFLVSFTKGHVCIYNIEGSKLIINLKFGLPQDAVIKMDAVENTSNNLRVIILTMNRQMFIYDLNNLKVENIIVSSLDFIDTPILSSYINGLNGLLVIGSYNQKSTVCEAYKSGIILFRLIDEEPYYQTIDELQLSKSGILTKFFPHSSDGVCDLQINQAKNKIVALHLSGNISIWSYPSMRIIHHYNMKSKFENMKLSKEFLKGKVLIPDFLSTAIHNICWWNDEFIVLTLYNGRIILLNEDNEEISDKHDLELLPFTKVVNSVNKTIYTLECASFSQNSQLQPDNQIETRKPPVNWSILSAIKLIYRYFGNTINDTIPQFDNQLCSQVFKLSCFRITNYEELFEIRLKRHEFFEALSLAQTYQLDTDIVYHQQWCCSEKSVKDIKSSLIKITKVNWILNECLHCIPDNIQSLKQLISLGLQLTNFDELKYHENSDNNLIMNEDFVFNDNLQFRNSSVRQEDIDEFNVDKLTYNQTDLLDTRFQLLDTCDKINIFQLILKQTETTFDIKNFQQFQQFTPFELAIKYARDGDLINLQVVLDFHQSLLLPHLLSIVSNVPEVCDPKGYCDLIDKYTKLPTNDRNDKIKDWCENEKFQRFNESIIDSKNISVYYIENEQCEFMKITNHHDDDEFKDKLKQWFEWRIYQIESNTFQIELCQDLIKYSKKLDVKLSDDLIFNLNYLYEILYKKQIKNLFLTLKQIEQMSDIEKSKLILTDLEIDLFSNHFNLWLLPILQQVHLKHSRDEFHAFFRSLVIEISKSNIQLLYQLLIYPILIDKILKLISLEIFIEIFIDILLNNDAHVDLKYCEKISMLLSEKIDASQHKVTLIQYKNKLQIIEKYITVLQILSKYNSKKSIKYLVENSNNTNVVENYLQNLLCSYINSQKKLDKLEIKAILSDIEICMSLVFKCLHPKLIYKLLIVKLLESGDWNNKMVKVKPFLCLKSTQELKVQSSDLILDFPDSISCILQASKSYIDCSVNSKDHNIQLALQCLNIIQEHTKETKFELELIKCCEILEKFNYSTIPIELRHQTNKFPLLEECLKQNSTLYKSVKELTEAGYYLYDATKIKYNDNNSKKGEVLRLVARYALENSDMEILDLALYNLMELNHKLAWKEGLMALNCAEFPIKEKVNISHFVVTYCPDKELSNVIKLIDQINTDVLKISMNDSNSQSSTAPELNSSNNSTFKYFSNNLMSKVSLKSLIDKSSSKITKLAEQLSDISKTNDKLIGKQHNMPLYHLKRFYETDYFNKYHMFEQNSSLNLLIKTLSLSLEFTNHNELKDLDTLHLNFIKYHISTDSLLALVHGVFVKDLSKIVQLKFELSSNSFSRCFIFNLIVSNLLFKYTGQFLKLSSTNNIDRNLNMIQSKLTDQEKKYLSELKWEMFESVLLEKIKDLYQPIDLSIFHSSADFRYKTLLEITNFTHKHSIELFDISKQLCRHYSFNEFDLQWNFIKTYLDDYDVNKIDFLLSNLDDVLLLKNHEKLIENFVNYISNISNHTNKLKYFNVILKFLEQIDPKLIFYGICVAKHYENMKIFDTVFKHNPDYLTYWDFVTNNTELIIQSLQLIISNDNLNDCSLLMTSFSMNDEFERIKNDFSSVLANQIMWSNNQSQGILGTLAIDDSGEMHDDFMNKFDRSLHSFSDGDWEKLQDFLYSTVFECKSAYLSVKLREELLQYGVKFIDKKFISISDSSNTKNWSKLLSEISIWIDHIKNTINPTMSKLSLILNNLDNQLELSIEYLGPDNYWECMLNELFIGHVDIEDIFTVVWELSIDMLIVEDAVTSQLKKICNSILISDLDELIARVMELINQASEYMEVDNIDQIFQNLLNDIDKDEKFKMQLLIEYKMKIGKLEMENPTISKAITFIATKIGFKSSDIEKILSANESDMIQKFNVLIGQLGESLEAMLNLSMLIELIELFKENTKLWQHWIKNLVLKGDDFVKLIYGRFEELKKNKLYEKRISTIIRDSVSILYDLYSAEAVSIIILSDPVNSTEKISAILQSLKSTGDFSKTMRNIDPRALQLIIDQKLVPIYAKTPLFQRIVNYLTKELVAENSNTSPEIVQQQVIDQLKQNNLHEEASWLLSSSSQINPALRTFGMVSGFWKKFSG